MFERASCLLRRPRGRALLATALLALALAAAPLAAQQAGGGGVGGPAFGSDSVPLNRTIPAKEEIQNEMTRSKLRFGPARVLPSFNVWNAGYDSNVFGTNEDPTGDWTLSVNAGATFLVPFGSKFVLRADAFPQYTWYKELSGRDEFGGRYEGSLYGFFNRMTVEITGGYFQQYQQYSTELDTFVFQNSLRTGAKVDVDLTISSLALRVGRLPGCDLSADRRPSRSGDTRPAQRSNRLGRARGPPIPDPFRLECRRRWRGDVGGLHDHSRAPEQHEYGGARERRVQSNAPALRQPDRWLARGKGRRLQLLSGLLDRRGILLRVVLSDLMARAPGGTAIGMSATASPPQTRTTSRTGSAARSTSSSDLASS